MKNLKHLVFAAIGLSLMAIPAAEAQTRHNGHTFTVQRQAAPPTAHRPGHAQRPSHAQRPHVRPAPHAHRQHWSHGQRYGNWRRHSTVRDYHRYGLRRPGHGQHWIKVNNDYLLISTATGVIASIIAGR